MGKRNQTAHYEGIFGYPMTSVVYGKTEGGRSVEVYLPHSVILSIAKYLKEGVNLHVGHAIWHMQNPDYKFPCEMCVPTESD